MDAKWKQIANVKEIGEKTGKIETMEFPEYISSNCNLTTCRYNKDGKCTDDKKCEIFARINPSERWMYIGDGIGHTDVLKKFGIDISQTK